MRSPLRQTIRSTFPRSFASSECPAERPPFRPCSRERLEGESSAKRTFSGWLGGRRRLARRRGTAISWPKRDLFLPTGTGAADQVAARRSRIVPTRDDTGRGNCLEVRGGNHGQQPCSRGLSSSGYCWRIRRSYAAILLGAREAKADRLVFARERSVSHASTRTRLIAMAVKMCCILVLINPR